MESIERFNQILESFRIRANCIGGQEADSYYYYDLKLAANARVRDVHRYSDEISLALKASCRPSIKVLHDQGIVRLEFAVPRTSPLCLFDLFINDDVPEGDLICLLGQGVDGRLMWIDLAQNPHMLIAGTTGSGKSTLLHNIIANLHNYNDCALFLIDPKKIEFGAYDGHLPNTKVYHSYEDTLDLIDILLDTMEQRYALMRTGTPASDFPYIVLIIDEFADLVFQDTDEVFLTNICRLAQKSRAARISVILATQRPSVDIIKGSIKANFPARLACRVASHVDSKVILDATGAENLLGKGDALVRDNFRFMERFQVAYITAPEIVQFYGK
jgi:DNA segregation ATPase FtsK/SpoIIIE, S-DNA-T family